MTAVGIIPARFASTRLPGKILASIAGKPMIERVWQRARMARELSRVIIACDEEHVLSKVKAFGAEGWLTSKSHVSGSDRVAEVARQLAETQIVVNIQGDEPFIDPALIDELVKALQSDTASVVATAVKRINSAEELTNPNVVKAVVDKNENALYFSRSPIPYKRDGKIEDFSGYLRHLGIYAYRKNFLLEYCQWPKSFLEREESLEQLRVLEAGFRIKTVLTETETLAVDTPEDLARVNKEFETGRFK